MAMDNDFHDDFFTQIVLKIAVVCEGGVLTPWCEGL